MVWPLLTSLLQPSVHGWRPPGGAWEPAWLSRRATCHPEDPSGCSMGKEGRVGNASARCPQTCSTVTPVDRSLKRAAHEARSTALEAAGCWLRRLWGSGPGALSICSRAGWLGCGEGCGPASSLLGTQSTPATPLTLTTAPRGGCSHCGHSVGQMEISRLRMVKGFCPAPRGWKGQSLNSGGSDPRALHGSPA